MKFSIQASNRLQVFDKKVDPFIFLDDVEDTYLEQDAYIKFYSFLENKIDSSNNSDVFILDNALIDLLK